MGRCLIKLYLITISDSLAHLNASLDKLVTDLAVDGREGFKVIESFLEKRYPHLDSEECLKLLLRKGT